MVAAMSLVHRFEQTDDRQVNSLQKTAAKTVTKLNACPFIEGYDTGYLTYTSGETKAVTHKLGRLPTGFIVIDAYGGYIGSRRDETATGTTTSFVRIQCEHAGTYRFWIY